MSERPRRIAVGALAAAAIATAGGTASASKASVTEFPPSKSPPVPVATGGGRPPAGYTIVTTPPVASPPGQQAAASAPCPPGTVAFGGGVFVLSTSPRASIRSSFPGIIGWTGVVSNGSSSPTTFNVQVVCGRRPRRYAIVQSSPVPVPAGRQATAFVHCPGRMLPLGGGAISPSNDTAVTLNSSLPSGPTWRADQNNGSAFATTVVAIAVCGKLKGYTVAVGPETFTGPFAQTKTAATCPAPTVPVGGGAVSFASDTLFSLNSTIPSAGGWASWINVADGGSSVAQAMVVCAGT